MDIKLVLLILLFPMSTLAQLQVITSAPAGPSSLANGWTIVQDNIQTQCSGSSATCTYANCTGGSNNECIAPTVAGSISIMTVITSVNRTISNASSGSGCGGTCTGTWTHSPSSAGGNATLGLWQDQIYSLNAQTGTVAPSVTLSSSTGANWWVIFSEFLPPPGYSASYDASGSVNNSTCDLANPCVGVALTINATDLIYQCCAFTANDGPNVGGKSWSSPYFQSAAAGNGICLNCTSGSAPTMTSADNSFQGAVFSALAFKSTAGKYTYTGSNNFSLVWTGPPYNTGAGFSAEVSCNSSSTCPAATMPTFTAGDLAVLIESDNTNTTGPRLSSIACTGATCANGTNPSAWVIPTGAGTCGANAPLSCAYNLYLPSGLTSITPTLTANTTQASFILYIFHRSSGTWALDNQRSDTNAVVVNPISDVMTCNGTNDVILNAIWATGGVSGVQYSQVGHFPGGGANGLSSTPFTPSVGALLNSTNCGKVIFPFENTSSASPPTFKIAFQ